LERLGKTGWVAFKSALRIAKEASDWNPILKAALGGVTAALDHIDVRAAAVAY
jgi:hypothetical protein